MSENAKSAAPFWHIHAAGAAAIVALSGLFYALAVAPAVSAREADLVRRAELEARSKKEAALTAALHRTEGDLAAIERALKSSALDLKTADAVNQHLDGLIRVAGKRGVRVDGMQPGTPVERGLFVKVPIRLSGAGSFTSCIMFLHDLNEEFRDTGLQSIELATDPTSPEGGGTFVFNLSWYAAPGGAISLAK